MARLLCHSLKREWPRLECLREDPELPLLRLSSSGRSTHVSRCDKKHSADTGRSIGVLALAARRELCGD